MVRHRSRNSLPVPGPEPRAGEQRGTTDLRSSRAAVSLFLESRAWREPKQSGPGGSHEGSPYTANYLRRNFLPGDSGGLTERRPSVPASRDRGTEQPSLPSTPTLNFSSQQTDTSTP